jgi:peroxiredoxin
MKFTAIILLLACLLCCSGCMMPDPKEQIAANEPKLKAAGYIRPQVGDPVIDFTVSDESGAVFSLGEALQSGPVMLFFYPANDTPNSTNQLHQLGRLQEELQTAGLGSIYAVNSAPAAETADFLKRKNISGLHVLEDRGLRISQSFGCASDDGSTKLQERSVVGIAQDGTIAFFQRRYFSRPPSLKMLQGAEYYNSSAAAAKPEQQ